jgi:methylmalonyl-CoA/ethylmalonyl-CoA epimerase
MFSGVHHLGYTVESMDETIGFYEKAFGGRVLLRKAVPGVGEVAFVTSGNTMVELVEPIEKGDLKGQVFAHVGYQVPDIEAAMAELKAKGYKLATDAPTVTVAGWKIIYLDQASALGARIHLTEV